MMQKSSLVILVVIGLALAITSSALFPSTLTVLGTNYGETLGSLLTGVVAAGIAGRALVGRAPANKYSRLMVILLGAVSFGAVSSALSSVLISSHVVDPLGKTSQAISGAFITAIVIGAVLYLVAATIYGFVGTKQGVGVGARVGLLLLLLLSVVPILNVLGLVGFLIAALVRNPSRGTPVGDESQLHDQAEAAAE